MDKKRSIGICISHQRLEALSEVCSSVLRNLRPVDGNGLLLREYIRGLQHKLWSMAREAQETYTLSLTSDEAMAYNQLWQLQGVKDDKYTAIIIGAMFNHARSLAA
jgi:hypothetical protein